MLLLLASVGSRFAHACASPDPIAAMVAKVAPAVVRIITVWPPTPDATKTGAHSSGDNVKTGIGSGFIIDPSGYIGTNKHLIDGAISVFVITADGVRYPAKTVGMPVRADIALLRIDAGDKQLPFVQFGDSDKVRVGDQAIAIGSPFGFENTVTSGIISALNRDIMESPFDDYLQTDAAINHGNSGGPLFNLSGEVIGMTSVIFSPDPGSAGVGFAVPSNSLKFVFDRLMKTGKVSAGMLPVHTQPISWGLKMALQAPDLLGALVTSVQDPGDTMLHGKIQAGDVIMTFNGQKVVDPRDLARKVARSPIGSDAELEILRGDHDEAVHVAIQALPEAKPIVLEDQPRMLGLGLTAEQQNDGGRVVKVASVDPNGTAASSGIQNGDTLVEVQQTPVSEPDQALRVLRDVSSGNRHFAAVLVRHDKTLTWLALAVPD
jgi:serine protease Do